MKKIINQFSVIILKGDITWMTKNHLLTEFVRNVVDHLYRREDEMNVSVTMVSTEDGCLRDCHCHKD
jgi:hypothetical protein